MVRMPLFTDSEIKALADALGDTDHGLTSTEISHSLLACRIRLLLQASGREG